MAEQEIPEIALAFNNGVMTLDELATKFGPSEWTNNATKWANGNSTNPIAQCIIGINHNRLGNDNDAFQQFELAAKQGNAAGMYWLAKSYEAGKGVPQNKDIALHLIQQSAVLGHAGAQCQLGLLIENKRIAFDYFKNAADQDHTFAKNVLATPEMRKIASNKSIVNEFSKGGSKRSTRRKQHKKHTIRKRHNKRRV